MPRMHKKDFTFPTMTSRHSSQLKNAAASKECRTSCQRWCRSQVVASYKPYLQLLMLNMVMPYRPTPPLDIMALAA